MFGVGSSPSLSNKVFILYLSYVKLNMIWAERGWVGRGKEVEKEERRGTIKRGEEGEINDFMFLYVFLPKLLSEFQVPDSLF